jgi:hypothetical protein
MSLRVSILAAMKTKFFRVLLPLVALSITLYALWKEDCFYRDIQCFPIPLTVPSSYVTVPCINHFPYPAILLNDAVNLPAVEAFWFCFPQWRWGPIVLLSVRSFVLLSFVAVWWWILGLELDFHLLRRANKVVALHYLWLGLGTAFQALVFCLVLYGAVTHGRLDDQLRTLAFLCWFQVLALIFLRSPHVRNERQLQQDGKSA